MNTDHRTMRLGKRPRRHDGRTLKLARYMAPALPKPPANVDYTRGVTEWGMMLNDSLGCCTIAAVAHAVQTWTANASAELTVPDSAILQYYEQWDGYNPADADSDQGGVELDVLKSWRQQGFSGHGLDAFVAIEPRDAHEVAARSAGRRSDRVNGGKNGLSDRQIPAIASPLSTAAAAPPIAAPPDHPLPQVAAAIWLFGGCYIGLELPLSAQDQDLWDVVALRSETREAARGELSGGDSLHAADGNPASDFPVAAAGGEDLAASDPSQPGSWGGHAVYLVGYDFRAWESASRQSASGAPNAALPTAATSLPPTLTCITWGQIKKMTWRWFARYCSEAYALVSKDWLNGAGVSPSGFDLATLEADLKAVTS
jgi:hypothetical protein